MTAEELSIYAGRYRLDASTIYIVEPAAGGLQVKVPLEETFTLVPVSRVGYVRRDSETRYTFGRRADGGALVGGEGRRARIVCAWAGDRRDGGGGGGATADL